MIRTQNIDNIFDHSTAYFVKTALEYFRHQAAHSSFYQKYLQTLQHQFHTVEALYQIPFMPVQFFKHQRMITENVEAYPGSIQLLFESSGTSGQINSRHEVQDHLLYEKSFTTCFKLFYGDIQDYCILGLLPSYLERSHSSLVYMVNDLIKKSIHPSSNFYLYDHDELYQQLQVLEAAKQKTLLIGVTYALLDFAENFSMDLKYTFVIETGGMKGRREELIRAEVHEKLKASFGLQHIHAEYGMTELLSQAYSKREGIFTCPPWMKVMVRDVNDPFQVSYTGKGVLNIIDLANIHSCCFIATDDIGEVFADGTFTVNGRLDLSDLRGCSLMYES